MFESDHSTFCREIELTESCSLKRHTQAHIESGIWPKQTNRWIGGYY